MASLFLKVVVEGFLTLARCKVYLQFPTPQSHTPHFLHSRLSKGNLKKMFLLLSMNVGALIKSLLMDKPSCLQAKYPDRDLLISSYMHCVMSLARHYLLAMLVTCVWSRTEGLINAIFRVQFIRGQSTLKTFIKPNICVLFPL